MKSKSTLTSIFLYFTVFLPFDCGTFQASLVALVLNDVPANAEDIRDAGSIAGSGRSPGGGPGSPVQCSCLESPMDRGAWRAVVHRVTKSHTRLKPLAHTRTRGAFQSHTEHKISTMKAVPITSVNTWPHCTPTSPHLTSHLKQIPGVTWFPYTYFSMWLCK